jgi:hypothetical protein
MTAENKVSEVEKKIHNLKTQYNTQAVKERHNKKCIQEQMVYTVYL